MSWLYFQYRMSGNILIIITGLLSCFCFCWELAVPLGFIISPSTCPHKCKAGSKSGPSIVEATLVLPLCSLPSMKVTQTHL